MTSVKWIGDSTVTTLGHFALEPRKGTTRVPIAAAVSFADGRVDLVWPRYRTARTRIGVRPQSYRGVVDTQFFADESPFSLDDPPRQPVDFSRLGLGRRSPSPGLEPDRGATEHLSLELSRMPGSALGISAAIHDRIHRPRHRFRRLACSRHISRSRAILPAGDHELASFCLWRLACSPDGKAARSRWASAGRIRHRRGPRGAG